MKRVLNFLLFRNIFIAACAVGMYYTTLLINDLTPVFNSASILLFCSTCLYYNFHRFTHRINFGSLPALRKSIAVIRISFPQMILYLACFSGLLLSLMNISLSMLFVFAITAILGMAYSIPLIPRRGKRHKIREFLYIKLPYLSLAWAVLTVLLPLMDQEINILSWPVFFQFLSRSLFIYTLCIPFEIRDMEKEKYWENRTLPVVFGQRVTKWIGYSMVILTIISNHLLLDLEFSPGILIALDATSVLAFLWILFSKETSSPYYYKFYVDGTMLLQYLFVYLAAVSA